MIPLVISWLISWVSLRGIFCFFQRVLSFAFSLEDNFPFDFVDNLICQKFCGMLVRPLNQGITISWRALSSSLMWTLLLRMYPTSEKINTLLDIHKWEPLHQGHTFEREDETSSSISSGAQYVILHSKIGWRKSKVCRFGSGKWFWLCIIASVVVAGERGRSTVHMQKRV